MKNIVLFGLVCGFFFMAACTDVTIKSNSCILNDSTIRKIEVKYKLSKFTCAGSSVTLEKGMDTAEIRLATRTELFREMVLFDICQSAKKIKSVSFICWLAQNPSIFEQNSYDSVNISKIASEYNVVKGLHENMNYIYLNISGEELTKYNSCLKQLPDILKGVDNIPVDFIDLVKKYSKANEKSPRSEEKKHFAAVLRSLKEVATMMGEDGVFWPRGFDSKHIDYFLEK